VARGHPEELSGNSQLSRTAARVSVTTGASQKPAEE
jgi:hypothetical protein